MRFLNLLIFLFLLGTAAAFHKQINFSTNLIELFASPKTLETVNAADKMGYSNELLIAVKGFSSTSKGTIEKIASRLIENPSVTSVETSAVPDQKTQSYLQAHYPLLSTFHETDLSESSIYQRLERVRERQFNAAMYTPINTADPLGLFTLPNVAQPPSFHSSLTLPEFGFLLRARTTVSPADLKEAKLLYHEVKFILSPYPDTLAFSPFFYSVENSGVIQGDVTKIIFISSILLILIYWIILRNIHLLSQTLIALGSSILAALLLSSSVFETINLMALAFGISISTVSIDYMFHNFFHNRYTQRKVAFDKDIFFGFITTFIAFMILYTIPIPLVSQMSFFSAIALLAAYLLFTSVFPYLDLQQAKPTKTDRENHFRLHPVVVTVVSAVFLFIALKQITFDTNLRHLDYQNNSLQSIEKQFTEALNQKQYVPVLIQADTQDQLLGFAQELQSRAPSSLSAALFALDQKRCRERKELLASIDFSALRSSISASAEQLGFRKGLFENAYNFTRDLPSCDIGEGLEVLKRMHMPVIAFEERYISLALIVPEEMQSVQPLSFVEPLDIAKSLEKSASIMHGQIVNYSVAALGIILILLAVAVRRRFFYALNFMLFPIAASLLIISLLGPLNIMHLFALIILLAIGIDYGIYMSRSKAQHQTRHAIRYALLSTFAGFGVLIFSSITALFSIGITITTGIIAMHILLKGMR
ncbi:MAG: hypothetical protein U9Q62_12015 [Campylobacterota bacterium]|nr:hypothetical protein [Campylobacterota bacterium]